MRLDADESAVMTTTPGTGHLGENVVQYSDCSRRAAQVDQHVRIFDFDDSSEEVGARLRAHAAKHLQRFFFSSAHRQRRAIVQQRHLGVHVA